MKIRKYKLLIVGTVGLLVAIVTVLLVRPKHASGAPAAVDPTEVEVVQVEQKDVPVYGEWIGTLDGLENADVRAQVTGYLLEQDIRKAPSSRRANSSFRLIPARFRQLSIKPRDNLHSRKPRWQMRKPSRDGLNLMSNATRRSHAKRP